MYFRFRQRLLLPILLVCCLLTGCSAKFLPGSAQDTEAAISFDEFSEHFFRTEISSNTINLHFTLSDPEDYGITDPPISLGSLTQEAADESRASLENALAVLKTFDYDSLSAREKLDYEILTDYLQMTSDSSEFMLYDEILRPSTGIQAQLPVLYEEYRFYEKQDIEDYLALISLTGDYFDQIIEFERQKASAGLFMPDFACDTIISQCEAFTQNRKEHYLITTFNHKLSQMTELSDAERQTYQAKNETLVKETILPAYEKLASALAELLGSATNNAGLCHLPNGAAYYEYLVRHNTGSDKSVREIQRMVEEQCSKDLSAAGVLMLQHPGLEEKCANVRLEGMDSVATLHVLQEEMLTQFPAAPDTEFTVSYIDECMEDYMAPAFYITAPIDNYQKNSIFINGSTDASTMRHFTTLAHEGFPGHLYQTVMSYEAGLSPVRSILNYPGYVEGWATYVEMLSYHYAGLETPVADLLSFNQSALLSLYAATDLGIHYDGWSFSDVLDFWADYGITDQNSLRNVYELIVEEPAHYLKYYVGYLEFLELKEEAKKRYEDAYSDLAFHRAVLAIGPAPFAIVEKYLDAYYLVENKEFP